MPEGQEGGLFSLIADVKYLIAVVIIIPAIKHVSNYAFA